MRTLSPSPTSRRTGTAAIVILVALSAAICVLCVVQWVVQSKLRERIEAENKEKVAALANAADQAAQAKRYSEEISRIDGIRKEFEELVRTNKAEVSRLKAENKRLEYEGSRLTNAVETYKSAYEKANAAILQQNESVKTQNEALKAIAEERNAMALKYNKLAEDYNKAVGDFNTLADQVKKEREAAALASGKN